MKYINDKVPSIFADAIRQVQAEQRQKDADQAQKRKEVMEGATELAMRIFKDTAGRFWAPLLHCSVGPPKAERRNGGDTIYVTLDIEVSGLKPLQFSLGIYQDYYNKGDTFIAALIENAELRSGIITVPLHQVPEEQARAYGKFFECLLLPAITTNHPLYQQVDTRA